MSTDGAEQFVSEQLVPVPGTGAAAGMARGEPGLPRRFTWRGEEYEVLGVLQQWKSSGPCHHGASEVYLRRHWYKILTQPHAVMTVYFERQANHPKRPKARWWIYSIHRADTPTTHPRATPP